MLRTKAFVFLISKPLKFTLISFAYFEPFNSATSFHAKISLLAIFFIAIVLIFDHAKSVHF